MRPRSVNGYLRNGYPVFEENGKRVKVHVRMVENILGRKISKPIEIHHVNSIRSDNRPENLVVCPNAAYHRLLHRRTEALDACGHPTWMKCKFCKQWDDPENLYTAGGLSNVAHKSCATEYRRKQRAA